MIAYRDRPEYVQGRERWRAYQHEALRARLDHLSGVRPPIEVDDHPRQSFLSEVFDMVNPLDPVQAFPQLFNRNERPSLGSLLRDAALGAAPAPRPSAPGS